MWFPSNKSYQKLDMDHRSLNSTTQNMLKYMRNLGQIALTPC